MQAQDILRQLWIPELDDLHHYLSGLPTNALVVMGTFAALTTYWLAFRPKSMKPRCDPNHQSLELPVGGLSPMMYDPVLKFRCSFCRESRISMGKDQETDKSNFNCKKTEYTLKTKFTVDISRPQFTLEEHIRS